MCNGPIFTSILKFAVPIVAGNFLQILFNAVDMAVVGNFVGSNALAAVGANISLINLILNLFIGLSLGANIVTARYCGAQSERDVEETVHCSMAICLLCGIFLAVFGILVAGSALRLLDTPSNIFQDAVVYLRVYALGFPLILIFNFARAIVNAEGDTKWPLLCLAVAGGLNVILNLTFVLLFHLEVMGVALATVISNGVSAFMMLLHLCRKRTAIRLRIRNLRITRDKAFEIIKVGLPAGLQGVAFSISHVIVQDAVNSFGSEVVTGNTAVINIEGFLYHAMYGFYQASGTFISQNYGAGNYARIKRILLTCLLSALTVGLGLSVLAILFRDSVIGLYSSEAPVIAAGAVRILVVFPLYCLCGMNDVMAGAMRGIGYSAVPLVVSLIGACVFRVMWIFTVFAMYPTLQILYVSYPVSWALTFCAHVICFRIFYHRVCQKRGQV
ncbi:MAG: MATE family efflux transporter [Firmicutes bacterium]|nr:MATE family efflux transporter [Bacillota bacterium]